MPNASAQFLDPPAGREVTYSSLGHSDYQSNATAQSGVAEALAKAGV